MSGISPASGIITARTALFAAMTTALAADADVDLHFGPQWPVTKTAWAQLTDTHADFETRDIAPRRSQDETITFGASIGAWVPGHDQAAITAAFNRAFGILDTIQTHIREHDITLDDTVLWCVPGSSDSDGIQDEDGTGYVVEIAATFVCAHRVRAA